MKHVMLVALLASGCGGDKCEKVYAKLAPAMEKEVGKDKMPDKAKMVGQCKDQLKQHPESEKTLDCIIGLSGTPSIEELDKCAAEGGRGDIGKGREKYKVGGEAGLQLTKLGKAAKRVFAETGAYPKGKVGPVPAGECCNEANSKTGMKCPSDASMWKDSVWTALEFSIDEPSLYHYSYESDGKTFTALAVGDADCDQQSATFTLKGGADGNSELVQPPKGSY